MNEIPNANLTEKDIPSPNANLDVISSFAHSFNGYAYWGSFEKCAKIANDSGRAWKETEIVPTSLTNLRTCLFFEQRRWRHFGYDPDEKTVRYFHALIEAIRNKVQNNDLE